MTWDSNSSPIPLNQAVSQVELTSVERQNLFLELLLLPGATGPTVYDDVRWAWDADPSEHLYIEKIYAIQSVGVYPDAKARLVRFNAALLVRVFPTLRGKFLSIQALRPMRFSGTLPGRPPAQLSVVG